MSPAVAWLLVGAGVVGVYVLACIFDPMVRCRSCHGSGMRRSLLASAFAPGRDPHHRCHRCGGNKTYPRLGAKLLGITWRR